MSSTTYNNDTAEYIRFQFHRFTSGKLILVFLKEFERLFLMVFLLGNSRYKLKLM